LGIFDDLALIVTNRGVRLNFSVGIITEEGRLKLHDIFFNGNKFFVFIDQENAVKKGRRKKVTAVQNEEPPAEPEVFASSKIFCYSCKLRAIHNISFFSNIFNNFQVKAGKAGRRKKEIAVHKEEPSVGPEVFASLQPAFRIRDPVPF
jgi:hypothetical protein